MKTSQKAVDKLKGVEQFSAKAYRDGSVNGVPKYSIGYGHQIQPNESSLQTATINQSTADTLFRSDLAPLENLLNKAKYAFNQNQFDALVSFGYNCGTGALQKVIDTWNSTHDASKVTAQMALYTKTHDNNTGNLVPSSALEQRRASEIMTFNSPAFPTLAVVGLASLVAMWVAFKS